MHTYYNLWACLNIAVVPRVHLQQALLTESFEGFVSNGPEGYIPSQGIQFILRTTFTNVQGSVSPSFYTLLFSLT
jgi:hypothetical protein